MNTTALSIAAALLVTGCFEDAAGTLALHMGELVVKTAMLAPAHGIREYKSEKERAARYEEHVNRCANNLSTHYTVSTKAATEPCRCFVDVMRSDKKIDARFLEYEVMNSCPGFKNIAFLPRRQGR